jgi:hypothetical protein
MPFPGNDDEEISDAVGGRVLNPDRTVDGHGVAAVVETFRLGDLAAGIVVAPQQPPPLLDGLADKASTSQ